MYSSVFWPLDWYVYFCVLAFGLVCIIMCFGLWSGTYCSFFPLDWYVLFWSSIYCSVFLALSCTNCSVFSTFGVEFTVLCFWPFGH